MKQKATTGGYWTLKQVDATQEKTFPKASLMFAKFSPTAKALRFKHQCLRGGWQLRLKLTSTDGQPFDKRNIWLGEEGLMPRPWFLEPR
jgi:hypothetical protein